MDFGRGLHLLRGVLTREAGRSDTQTHVDAGWSGVATDREAGAPDAGRGTRAALQAPREPPNPRRLGPRPPDLWEGPQLQLEATAFVGICEGISRKPRQGPSSLSRGPPHESHAARLQPQGKGSPMCHERRDETGSRHRPGLPLRSQRPRADSPVLARPASRRHTVSKPEPGAAVPGSFPPNSVPLTRGRPGPLTSYGSRCPSPNSPAAVLVSLLSFG